MNELYCALQQKIQTLLVRCQQLEEENQRLQHDQNHWRSERAELIEKNEHVRNKIDTMINHLRSLEQNR